LSISRPAEVEEKTKENFPLVLVFEANLRKGIKIVIKKADVLIFFWWMGGPELTLNFSKVEGNNCFDLC
jgi:hypothetical protein